MKKENHSAILLGIIVIVLLVLLTNCQYKKAVESCVEHGNEKQYCERVLK